MSESPMWHAVDKAIRVLEERSDIALITDRSDVVRAVAESASMVGLDGLSKQELNGVINVLNHVCNGPSPIEDWECHSITGLTKDELRHVLSKMTGTE